MDELSSQPVSNQCVYVHEIVDIRGHHRADYTHHMTANWSPGAQERRDQRCFGVWNILGSTSRWPTVMNLWEERSWDGIADSFEGETVGPAAQDPELAAWWSAASTFRSGGSDRLLIPASWSPTTQDVQSRSLGGKLYAHEVYQTRFDEAPGLLDQVSMTARECYGAHAAQLVGAFRTALRGDDEVIVIWSFAAWRDWAGFEQQWSRGSDGSLGRWRSVLAGEVSGFERTLMTDAMLSPTRTGRQPQFSDQRPQR